MSNCTQGWVQLLLVLNFTEVRVFIRMGGRLQLSSTPGFNCKEQESRHILVIRLRLLLLNFRSQYSVCSDSLWLLGCAYCKVGS